MARTAVAAGARDPTGQSTPCVDRKTLVPRDGPAREELRAVQRLRRIRRSLRFTRAERTNDAQLARPGVELDGALEQRERVPRRSPQRSIVYGNSLAIRLRAQPRAHAPIPGQRSILQEVPPTEHPRHPG